ncbi:phosphotransferase family protein [Minwuia sp.]|uniref:phosphotransferase family protein n=1 Tax=Minwuia sp. TaxID=2493630 RepID=UPI003A946FF5
MNSRVDEATALAAEIFGKPVDRIDRLVQSSVRAVRLHIGADSMIATRRPSVDRARLEAHVLKALHGAGGAVPALIGQRDRWVIQQDLEGKRMTIALWAENPINREKLVNSGLRSLRTLHEAGRRSGLSEKIPGLGLTFEWRRRLCALPERMSERTGIAAPALDIDATAERLMPRTLDLLKWDARPANAMVGPDGKVSWFDWEHCGVRDPLDDAGWFLGDEYMPDLNGLDPDAVAILQPDANGMSRQEAAQYQLRFGVLHMTVRLALILNKYDEYEGWRDWDFVLNNDKVGSTAEAFRRTAGRAARWSDDCDDLRPLARWFRELSDWCPNE